MHSGFLRGFLGFTIPLRSPRQNAKPGDAAALGAQCEPLLAVAEAHAEGKEAFARATATELFSDFLSVEERFAANKEATEQEVIDSLRQVSARAPGGLLFLLVVNTPSTLSPSKG